MTNKPTQSLEDVIDDILGEDTYNVGAFQFEDNKMRFAFTLEELIKIRREIMSLFYQEQKRLLEELRKGVDDAEIPYQFGSGSGSVMKNSVLHYLDSKLKELNTED